MGSTRWRKLSSSKNYDEASRTFQNLSKTPAMAADASIGKIIREMRNRPRSVVPPKAIPSIKTELKSTDLKHDSKPMLIWFGHSSYYIRYNETSFLIDPIFSDRASPVPGMIKAFPGSNAYKAADLPAIDYLIMTHNHYDHLDNRTIRSLGKQIKNVYAPLGVGEDIASVGIDAVPITEMDWWESETLMPGVTLTATPARHFSGRGLKRNGSLWTSYVLDLDGYRLFLGGDSGYDLHFKEIALKYGPFDLAVLECGQYGKYWPYIHMMPEETFEAALELKAKALLPVHWGKFVLSTHPWDDPVKRLLARAAAYEAGAGGARGAGGSNGSNGANGAGGTEGVVVESRAAADVDPLILTTPLIGEPVYIGSSREEYPHSRWWEDL